MEASWSVMVRNRWQPIASRAAFSHPLLQFFHDRVRGAAVRALVVAVFHERYGHARFP